MSLDKFMIGLFAALRVWFSGGVAKALPLNNSDVKRLAEEIVKREGGYVNDPSDPGGATKWGVTIGTMKALGVDLNGDGKVTITDTKLLTEEKAVEIYMEHYYKRPKIAELPISLQPSVFDMYVNSGNHAIKILQRLVGVTADGVIGPNTLRAVKMWYEKDPTKFVDTYGIARRDYYYALADARPASRKYARRLDGGKGGWITRAEEFISPARHLTDEQHRARVRNWR